MGDMSFIGPRPWIPEYHKHMSAKQRRRSDVRPGITGLAQSRGRNALTINEKIDFDLRYASHLSLYEDLKVIFFTLVTLYDKSTLHIGKSGIHDEIMELKKQQVNQGAGQNG
jgi:lipopolysaccharide/colanic/teichoic acid biosynthesis glycosyltransferase